MLFLIIVQMYVTPCLASDLYTSLTHVKSLLDFDDLVGMALMNISHPTQVQKSYLESYSWVIIDRNVAKFSRSGDIISENPLHIYALFKRMVLYWPDIKVDLQASMEKDNNNEVLQQIYNAQQITIFPTISDLGGCAVALARLQQVYRLNIEDMKQGILLNRRSNVRLSIYDFFRIANDSFHMKQYSNSWVWYKASLNEAQDMDMHYHITAHMDAVEQKHDSTWEEAEEKIYYFSKKLKYNREQSQPDTIWDKLCRGELVAQSHKRQLHCHISHMDHPYLALSPVKYEEVHSDPEIFSIYDVITEKEIQVLKDMAQKQLSRSGVTYGIEYESRVSKTAFLNDITHPVLLTLARRIEAITGLYLKDTGAFDLTNNKGWCEGLQVLSYGIGGHFLPHRDPLFKYTKMTPWEFSVEGCGDRIATWMFYLSDIVTGGGTAFPHAGVAVKPVKGSALFWYNLHRNGLPNMRSLHGGCPVLFGHKWAATKWIYENSNIFRRPCGLRPDI